MPASEFTCPNCRYEASLSMFENAGGGELRCRRCRSRFEDPNAYMPGMSYADCDSLRPVTRFPFALNGNNTMIRVRDGYQALILGTGGIQLWIDGHSWHITDMPDGFQLYYICLSPRIIWGVGVEEGFGAYGSAQLSISREYAKEFCGVDAQILTLEKYLRGIVDRRVAGLIQAELRQSNVGMLEHRDGYQNLLGVLEKGVSLVRIDPMGFRNGDETTQFYSNYAPQSDPGEAAEPVPAFRAPADIVRAPKQSYTVADGVEDVLIRGTSKAERHKAGERLDASALRGVEKLVRYWEKEFCFPFGWGIFNQPKPVSGYYSAQGTISFFVDSTERLGLLLAKTKSWQEFEEQFFANVIKKELSSALREVMSTRINRQGFQENRIDDYLSTMSVELTNLLNGEGASAREPAFRNHGLRVRQTDIIGIDFYSARR